MKKKLRFVLLVTVLLWGTADIKAQVTDTTPVVTTADTSDHLILSEPDTNSTANQPVADTAVQTPVTTGTEPAAPQPADTGNLTQAPLPDSVSSTSPITDATQPAADSNNPSSVPVPDPNQMAVQQAPDTISLVPGQINDVSPIFQRPLPDSVILIRKPAAKLQRRIIIEEDEPDTFEDGFYRLNEHEYAKPYAFPNVDKNNVVFYKRIWRDIDVTDSMNQIFATPGATLMDAILDGIKAGRLIPFDPTPTKENPTGDGFIAPLSPVQAMTKLSDSVLVPQFDENGNQIGAQMKLNEFNPSSVTKFRVKEDIFLDKQRSRIETRIIGIAPLIKINIGGEDVSEQPAFWLYFPQTRKVLITKEVIDPKRGINKQSMDDILIQHKFRSMIIKESNPSELSIKDYAEDRDQESRRIEKEITNYKRKFWQYK